MIGAQSDSIGEGAEGSESGEESDTLESRAAWRFALVFSSIAVETATPEVVSNHPSLFGVVGSELKVGADTGAASRVLFGGRVRSYPSRQCGTPDCGSNRPCNSNFQI